MQVDRTPLVEQIIHVLNRHDPMGLAPGVDVEAGGFAVPWDEYEFEARDLARLLHSNGTLTAAEVDDVWRKWFGEPTSAPELLAADVRALSR